eukprot:gene2817-4225_t
MNTKDELEIKKYLLNKFQEIPDFEWNQETKTILLQIIQQEKEQKKTNVQKLNFAYKMLNIKNETELYHLPEEEENITYKKKQKEFKQFIETKEISFEILEYENKIKEYEKEIKLQPEIIEINQIKSLKNKILTLKNENENIAQFEFDFKKIERNETRNQFDSRKN